MLRARTYERYSSDNQRPASIEDQRRGNRAYIDRQPGWNYTGSYSDSEMSGAIKFRPDYQRMLADARAGAFEVLVIESLDRIGRDLEETAGLYKRLTYFGIPLYATDDGLITDLHVGLKGTMDARFLKDLGAKVHRGLKGRAIAGKSAGGVAYGYRVVKQFDAKGELVRGDREIDEVEAAIVRRIFAEFAAGDSSAAIARRLNREGLRGPDGAPWAVTTIRGHFTRATGLLNNELYAGRLVWNRMRYMRDPDTGKRVSRMRPPEEWVVTEVPELRIVDDSLWNAVRAMQEAMFARMGGAGNAGARLKRANRPVNLLSGLLICAECGGPYTGMGIGRDGCKNHRLHAGCDNNRLAHRAQLEARIFAGIKDKLLTPEAFRIYASEFIAEQNRLNAEHGRRHASLEGTLKAVGRKLTAVMAAIEQGIVTPTTRSRLLELEAEKAAIEAELGAAEQPTAPAIHPGLAERFSRSIASLQADLGSEARPRAAEALRRLVTEIRLGRDAEGALTVELVGELGALVGAATGTKAKRPSQGTADAYAGGGCGSPNQPPAYTKRRRGQPGYGSGGCGEPDRPPAYLFKIAV